MIKYEKDAIRFYLHGDAKPGEDANKNTLKEINPEFIEKWIAIRKDRSFLVSL